MGCAACISRTSVTAVWDSRRVPWVRTRQKLPKSFGFVGRLERLRHHLDCRFVDASFDYDWPKGLGLRTETTDRSRYPLPSAKEELNARNMEVEIVKALAL